MEDAKPAMINPMSIPIDRSLLAILYALLVYSAWLSLVGTAQNCERKAWAGLGDHLEEWTHEKKQAQNVLVQGECGGDVGHDPERGDLPKDQGEDRPRILERRVCSAKNHP